MRLNFIGGVALVRLFRFGSSGTNFFVSNALLDASCPHPFLERSRCRCRLVSEAELNLHFIWEIPNSFPSSVRYVPNPSPSVFRTTKNNHNILQGVAAPTLRLTKEQKDNFDQWIYKNGLRWTAEGGPLSPGGVDVAFVGTLYVLYAEWLQIDQS